MKKRRANLVNNLKKKYDILRNQENADEILTILNRQHQAYNKDLQDFEVNLKIIYIYIYIIYSFDYCRISFYFDFI